MTLLKKTDVALRLSTFGLPTSLTLFLPLALILAMSSMALAGTSFSVTKLDDDTYLTYRVGANQLGAKVSAIRHALEFATETTFYADTRLVDGQMSSASSQTLDMASEVKRSLTFTHSVTYKRGSFKPVF